MQRCRGDAEEVYWFRGADMEVLMRPCRCSDEGVVTKRCRGAEAVVQSRC